MRNWKYVLLLALVFVLSPAMKSDAQVGGTLRIQNSGTTLNREPYLNFVNGGCVDNAGSTRTDCTFLTGSSLGNYSFTANTFNIPANALFTDSAISATNTTGLTIATDTADGATSVGTIVNNTTALNTAGAANFIIENAGSPLAVFDNNGNTGARLKLASTTASVVQTAGWGLSITTGEVDIVGDLVPNGNNSHVNGADAKEWEGAFSYWYSTKLGAQLTAAASILPTSGLHHITGATPITTITATNVIGNGRLTLIADSTTITFSTGGNIAFAGTISQGQAATFVYDKVGTTWYPVQ